MFTLEQSCRTCRAWRNKKCCANPHPQPEKNHDDWCMKWEETASHEVRTPLDKESMEVGLRQAINFYNNKDSKIDEAKVLRIIKCSLDAVMVMRRYGHRTYTEAYGYAQPLTEMHDLGNAAIIAMKVIEEIREKQKAKDS